MRFAPRAQYSFHFGIVLRSAPADPNVYKYIIVKVLYDSKRKCLKIHRNQMH